VAKEIKVVTNSIPEASYPGAGTPSSKKKIKVSRSNQDIAPLPMSERLYQKLLAVLRREMLRGAQSIQKYITIEKIRTNWAMGRHIDAELKGRDEAATAVYQRLNEDLNVSVRHLQDITRFYRTYPTMPGQSGLSWTHYNLLLLIDDPVKRRRLEERIIKEKIGVNDLRLLVHKPEAPLISVKSGRLVSNRGTLFAYSVMKVNSMHDANFLTLDCGFDISFYQTIPDGAVYKSGNLCRSVKEGEAYSLKRAPDLRAQDIYTYQALVERFVDGDTLLVNVDVGFGIWKREKLRFRGIDCPEMGTLPGNRARKFVEEELGKCGFVVIKTYKTDKYDRYLVDVFYLPGEKDPVKVAAEGMYLNQALIDKGLAQIWES